MGFCGSCVKYLLFIFNVFFVLCGIALIVVGSVLLANVDEFSNVADKIDIGLRSAQIALIVIGVIIFCIAFLGCCGAIRENKCMLITFGVLMLVIFIIQLAIGIYAVVTYDNESVDKMLQTIFDQHTDETQATFDEMQQALKCCGVHDSSDYGLAGLEVPNSCCLNGYCSAGYYNIGCGKALTKFAKDAGVILGGVAIGLGVIEILGSIFAFYRASKTDDIFRA